MKIVVLGASGMAGSRIVSEALSRGHEVTAISRHASSLEPRAGLTTRDADVKAPGLADLLRGHDVVISSLHFLDMTAEPLLAAARAAATRLVVVGGAGSLTVNGARFADSPMIPEEYRPAVLAGCDFLAVLQADGGDDWTFLSPPMMFAPGERTGKFRLGTDTLLFDDEGKSGISAEDYAIALLDEVEAPKHSGRRFTVGY